MNGLSTDDCFAITAYREFHHLCGVALEKIAILDTMETLDLAALEPIMPWLIGFGAYVLVMIGLAVAGLVLLCINKRRVSFAPSEMELPKGSRFKTAYVNVGMILLAVGCLALIVANVIPL